MKLNLSKIFDAAKTTDALRKGGIDIADFIDYVYSLSENLVLAVQGKLSIADNLNSTVRELTLRHGEPSEVGIPAEKGKTQASDVLVTQARPFANAVDAYNWQYDTSGNLVLVCFFRGAPTEPVTVRVNVLF